MAAIGASKNVLGVHHLSKSKESKNISDKALWNSIRKEFNTEDMVNLNNGSGSMMPNYIYDKYIENTKTLSTFAPYKILSKWEPKIKSNLQRIKELIGSQNGQILINQNSTSGINTIINGFPLKKKHEVLYSNVEYPHVEETILNRSIKEKFKVKKIFLNIPKISDREILECYRKAFRNKTKLLILTHITHRRGHIMPVKAICQLAAEHGIETMVDGAHSIGQIDHSLKEINCEYYVTSLHKWLNAPLGTGLLYIRNDKIEKINPPGSYPQKLKDKFVKFDYQGTRAFQNIVTTGAVLDFLDQMGIEKKQQRLNDLKKYWVSALKEHDKFIIASDINRSCAIASFRIKDTNSNSLKKVYLNKYKIHIKCTSGWDKAPIMRISPDIYTSFEDLDRFIGASIEIAENT